MDILSTIKQKVADWFDDALCTTVIDEDEDSDQFLEDIRNAKSFDEIVDLCETFGALDCADEGKLFGYPLELEMVDDKGNPIPDQDEIEYVRRGGHPKEVHEMWEEPDEYKARVQDLIDREMTGGGEDHDILNI